MELTVYQMLELTRTLFLFLYLETWSYTKFKTYIGVTENYDYKDEKRIYDLAILY